VSWTSLGLEALNIQKKIFSEVIPKNIFTIELFEYPLIVYKLWVIVSLRTILNFEFVLIYIINVNINVTSNRHLYVFQ
jgi:hypothetical protein